MEFCNAKKTTGGGTCKQPAGHGTDHVGVGRCKFHGGNTETHRKAAAEEEIRRGTLFYGEPRDVEPHVALLEEVSRTAGHIAYLEREIATKEDPTTGDVLRLQTLYRTEREHMVTVCRVALAAGIAERQVRIAEQMGATIASLFEAVFKDLKLTADQKKRAPGVVERHLRLVTEEAA